MQSNWLQPAGCLDIFLTCIRYGVSYPGTYAALALVNAHSAVAVVLIEAPAVIRSMLMTSSTPLRLA